MWRSALVSLLAFCLTGCGFELDQRPSVLIIAVEGLVYQDILCNSESLAGRDWSGFRTICDESVRFTHAFTPSLTASAAIASLLTGQYPSDHGLRHAIEDHLQPSAQLSSETAVSMGYRTAFFSGGAHVLRRSGLSQGFEVFDDGLALSHRELIKTNESLVNAWLDWVSEESSQSPFFAFLHFADMNFQQASGEVGESTGTPIELKLKQLSMQLERIQLWLKAQKRWNTTNVVLLGIHGRLNRNQELEWNHLSREMSQVSLFVKPARKVRDAGLEWMIDKNVSLVDLGRTLFDLLGRSEDWKAAESSAMVVSLEPALREPVAPWPGDRYLVTEAVWPWRPKNEAIRSALRRDEYLLVFDSSPKLYNSRTDRLETSPLNLQDPQYKEIYRQFSEQMASFGIKKFISPSELERDKLIVGHWLGRKRIPNSEAKILLTELAKRDPKDMRLRSWIGDLALVTEDWPWLESMGRLYKKSSWMFVAKRNLGRPVRWKPGLCYRLLAEPRSQLTDRKVADCEGPNLVSLVNSLRLRDEEDRRRSFERFKQLAWEDLLSEDLERANLALGGSIDASMDYRIHPGLWKLYLYLPEQKPIRRRMMAVNSDKNN